MLGRLLAGAVFPPLLIALQLGVVLLVRAVQDQRRRSGRAVARFMPGASMLDVAVLLALVTGTNSANSSTYSCAHDFGSAFVSWTAGSAQQFAVSRIFLEAMVCVDVNGTSYLAQDTSTQSKTVSRAIDRAS
jgi:hypothetical protein